MSQQDSLAIGDWVLYAKQGKKVYEVGRIVRVDDRFVNVVGIDGMVDVEYVHRVKILRKHEDITD